MARKLSIVLVDDSRSVLAQQQALLSELDSVNVVGTAGGGVEALRVVEDCRPDLVLMDIVMPGMDGFATLRILKSRFPELRVAMVSSVGGSESRANDAFRLGAVQVLCKPVDLDQLEVLVTRECKRLEQEDAQ